jgi:hypothetical protein
MGGRGLALAVCATTLALVVAACSGDEGDAAGTEEATTVFVTATETGPAPTTSTGESEEGGTTTETSGPEAADPAVLEDAAATTTAAGSARVASTVRITDPGRGQTRLSGKGAFDFAQRRGGMTVRLVEGEAGPFGDASKVVFAGSSVYYQLPPGVLGGNSRWIRVDLQSLADTSAVDLGPIVRGSQADPSQALLWLSAIAPGPTKIGEEEVRGVPTSRYRAAVDLNALEQKAPPGQAGDWSAYVQTLRDRIGLDFIPVEVWVDEDGLVRRVYHEYGFAAEGTSAIVTTELYDFGVDVSAKPPRGGQVTAMSDLIRP